MEIIEKSWICTDPDNNQFGRKIKDWVYEFKEKNRFNDINDEGKWIEMTINLEHYTEKQVEEIIQTYGYSLLPYSNEFIFDIYKNKETVNWIIAETIFEQESNLY